MNCCQYCGWATPHKCYYKCTQCFERWTKTATTIRQTGRTCAKLKEMNCGDVFLVPFQRYAEQLQESHSWLKDNIATPETLEKTLRGKRWSGELVLDHTMEECTCWQTLEVEKTGKCKSLGG